MTDRELIEYAAKAAGVAGEYHALGIYRAGLDPTADQLYWNPLTDNGDALRLAVTLRMHVDVHSNSVNVWWFDEYRKAQSCDEDFGDDPYAATRLAIVRAAAEIGKNMETQND